MTRAITPGDRWEDRLATTCARPHRAGPPAEAVSHRRPTLSKAHGEHGLSLHLAPTSPSETLSFMNQDPVPSTIRTEINHTIQATRTATQYYSIKPSDKPHKKHTSYKIKGLTPSAPLVCYLYICVVFVFN